MAAMPLFGFGGQAGTRRKHRLGFPLSPRMKARFLRRRRGYFPRPIHGEISALWFQAGWSGPRTLESLGPGDTPFFKELKCYKYLSLKALLSEGKKEITLLISPRLVPVTHIRTNMTTAGMMRERFFELLEKVWIRVLNSFKNLFSDMPCSGGCYSGLISILSITIGISKRGCR